MTEDSVDWEAVPGYPGIHRPEVIAAGRRCLVGATGEVAAADVAVPILLDIEAATHWSFDVGCHSPAGYVLLGPACPEYPVVAGEPGLFDVRRESLPAHAVLLSAECGRREH